MKSCNIPPPHPIKVLLENAICDTPAGFEKEQVERGLSNGLRLAKPKSTTMQCPVELYNTILQCWHQIPECRLTFEFLGDLLYDFEEAVESESHLKGNAFIIFSNYTIVVYLSILVINCINE
jgi:hypothetical protein